MGTVTTENEHQELGDDKYDCGAANADIGEDGCDGGEDDNDVLVTMMAVVVVELMALVTRDNFMCLYISPLLSFILGYSKGNRCSLCTFTIRAIVYNFSH